MTDSILTQIILPLVLALIMFGMGLSLTKQDFLELGKEPKPIAIGLFGQLLILPLLAYAIAVFFDLSEHLAVGIMILAACPGGTSSNILSHLARANLALSVSLTAVTTLICVVTTPLIISFANRAV
jgi:BASS family bile acid:Na+ symporter